MDYAVAPKVKTGHFEVKTLKILGRVSLDKRLMPEVALWHGAGRISVAVQSSSNKVAVYEISDH
jgi:hypothetical protein